MRHKTFPEGIGSGAALEGIAGIAAFRTAPAYGKAIRAEKDGISLEEAQEVHEKCLNVDSHNDMPVETIARKNRKLPTVECVTPPRHWPPGSGP